MIAIISVLKNRCISKFNQKDTKLVIKNIAYFFQKNDMYTLLNVTNNLKPQKPVFYCRYMEFCLGNVTRCG